VSRVSQLTGERSLLDEVRASLVQGDASHALDRLRASRREFPHPILAEERDALTVEALVGARHYDEARAAADAFHEHFPRSLFSGAIDTALRSIP
jgi:outer membrane protein assembly factor BamD (BamD/ComL family)